MKQNHGNGVLVQLPSSHMWGSGCVFLDEGEEGDNEGRRKANLGGHRNSNRIGSRCSSHLSPWFFGAQLCITLTLGVHSPGYRYHVPGFTEQTHELGLGTGRGEAELVSSAAVWNVRKARDMLPSHCEYLVERGRPFHQGRWRQADPPTN